MKIGVIPLDIRPYNRQFLFDIAAMDQDVELLMPRIEELGKKKLPANTSYLANFLLELAPTVNHFVVSMDMLVYGGLFPARLHHEEMDDLLQRIHVLRQMKALNPKMKLYCSTLILRTPQYNSSLEEPNYYEHHGYDIFRYGVLLDHQQSNTSTDIMNEEFEVLKMRIPKEALDDFINRRNKNRLVIEEMLNLVHEGIIEVLVIPQDDAYPYGFTRMDQELIRQRINQLKIQDKVYLHPGTDESGCTLLCRCYIDSKKPMKVHTDYLIESFKEVIPLVEDRSFEESLQSHLGAVGMIQDSNEFDVCLAISGCPSEMIDASTYYHGTNRQGIRITDITTMEYRKQLKFDQRDFNAWLHHLKHITQPIYVLDATFCNGGEYELVEHLIQENMIESIKGYSGWNTTCNRVGCLLATIAFSYYGQNMEAIECFKWQRIASDLVYSSDLSITIQQVDLPKLNATYDNFNDHETEIQEVIAQKVNQQLKHLYQDIKWRVDFVETPFSRMTGIGFHMKKGELS